MSRRPSTALCIYANFVSLLPVPITRAKILQMSRNAKFPAYIRPSDRKSEPVFRRVDVLNWIADTYSEFFPTHVAEIMKTGFAPMQVKGKSRG